MTGSSLVEAAPRRRLTRRVVIALVAALTCVVLLCCSGAAYIAYNVHRAPNAEREMEAFATDLCQDLSMAMPTPCTRR